MSHPKWPMVPLGELIKRNENVTEIVEGEKYQEVTIRLWGKGVVRRQYVDGADQIGAKRFRVSAGQFIVSRIDARNGAMGIVPEELDNAIVTNDFPSFNVNEDLLLPSFIGWLCRTPSFVELCLKASEGTTNRVRLKEDRFLSLPIAVPDVLEQKRIAAKLNWIATKLEDANKQFWDIDDLTLAALRSYFARIISGAKSIPMVSVAPLVRRPILPASGATYPELGVRSFGKGTFHKPSLDFMSVGSKKLYRIESGDLVFSNVFAWEGAIAVAKTKDHGRVGSHRFITCVPKEGVATSDYLCFYFLTPEGMAKIGEASPGGAGRNRTLGLSKLEKIEVPVPDIAAQRRFGDLLKRMRAADRERVKARANLDAMMPSILDRAFKGEL